MTRLPLSTRFRHLLILALAALAVSRDLYLSICCYSYILLTKGLFWVAQVLLAPLLMGAVLALLTLFLAKAEFRTVCGEE